MDNLKEILEIIKNRKPKIKKVARARNIIHIDGSSEIKIYYQSVKNKNKIRKKEICKLKKCITFLINNLNENENEKIIKLGDIIYNELSNKNN